jgi:hypothetical protein
MHYEWLELAVSISPAEIDQTGTDENGDLLSEQPVMNPTAQLAHYHYPVDRIGPDFLPQQADGQLYYYLLYRDQNDQVRFIQLNPVSARLIELLQRQEFTGQVALQLIADEINYKEPKALLEVGRGELEMFRRAGVLLGTRRTL